MRRRVAVGFSAMVLLGACGTGEPVTERIESEPTPSTLSGEEMVASEPGFAEETLRYGCHGIEFTVEEIEAALAGPPATEVVDVRVFGDLTVPDASEWATLQPGLFVDRVMLAADPAGLVYVGDDWAVGWCVPRRRSFIAPLVWAPGPAGPEGPTVLLAPCTSTADLLTDARVVGDDVVLTIGSAWEPALPNCADDRPVEFVVDLPPFSGRLLDGGVWPWRPPATELDLERLDPSLAGLVCDVLADANSVTPRWRGLPEGASATVFRGDLALIEIQGGIRSDTESSPELEAAMQRRVVDYGWDPAFFFAAPSDDPWMGPDVGVFSDFSAPAGVTSTYTIRATSTDGSSATVDCGTGGISAELPAPQCSVALVAGHPAISLDISQLPSPSFVLLRDGVPLALPLWPSGMHDLTAPLGSTVSYQVTVEDTMRGRGTAVGDCGSVTLPTELTDVDRLTGAEVVHDARLGVWAYVTVELRCAGCPVEPIHLTGQATGVLGERDWQVVAGPDPATLGVGPVDPESAFAVVGSALAEGRSVTFEVDTATGVLRSWSVDGVGVVVTCFEVDGTRGPDMRSDRCTDDQLAPAGG